MPSIDSVLVANRGEIAVRIIATLRRLGIRAVAVYSDADDGAAHVRVADVAVRLGPAPASASYLDAEALLAAARATDVDAVHPGYGFLAESAEFARAVVAAGRGWIGPPPAAIAAMGDKIAAKHLAVDAGVPVVPGVFEPGLDDAALIEAAGGLGVPLLVKAAAGGGGKGMRRVDDPAELGVALRAARTEAAAAFGSSEVMLERLIERARHLEVQVLADGHGNVVHLGERECSLQRRHQKIVEESPSPVVGPRLRAEMGAGAVALAQSVGYVGAGTVEYVAPADEPSGYCWVEMNTRLQVEHPVTEAVTGLDLVEWQVRVAAGERLGFDQTAVTIDGHAIEARVYAEDPAHGFLPTGGRIAVADQRADGCRVDTGVAAGDEVTSDYDPLLAKVVAHASDRDGARRRLRTGLARFHLLGVVTNVAFVRALLEDPRVVAGRLDTELVERVRDERAGDDPPAEVLLAAATLRRLAREPTGASADPFAVPDGWRLGEAAWTPLELVWRDGGHAVVRVRGPRAALEARTDAGATQRVAAHLEREWLTLTVDGRTEPFVVADTAEATWVGREGCVWALGERSPLAAARTAAPAAVGPLVAPMPGTVTEVVAAVGDRVVAGQVLLVVEAMKLQHPVASAADGQVTAVRAAVGDRVTVGQPLVELDAEEEP